MSESSDFYKTLSAPATGIFRDRGSKFHAFLFPVTSEREIKEHLAQIRKEHYSARHHCYAWRLGVETIRFRANDDGEPSSTAGKPILGQLTSHDLTNVLCVVVRYFGGTLLGVGGLINAYRMAASDAIANASVEARPIERKLILLLSYPILNAVMQLIKSENLTPTAIQMEERVEIHLSVLLSAADHIESLFSQIYGVTVQRLD